MDVNHERNANNANENEVAMIANDENNEIQGEIVMNVHHAAPIRLQEQLREAEHEEDEIQPILMDEEGEIHRDEGDTMAICTQLVSQ